LFVSQDWDPSSPHGLTLRAADDRYGNFGRLVRCRHCGLVYTNPRLEGGPLLDAYARTEDAEYMGEDASRSINGYFCLNTISQFVPAGKLLDVGCSTGYLLNAVRLRFETLGIEPSRWAAGFAKEQLRLQVSVGTLEEAHLPDDSYDAVTLVDVLEHLPDPLGTLKEIRRVLKPDGFLYIVTPNIASVTAKLMRSRWWGLRAAHIYYFSPRTLTALLKKAGFEPVLLRSYGRVFTLDYWRSRLRTYSGFINRILSGCIRRFGLGRKLVYINTLDSIECCARKSNTSSIV
jgi:2-polyprenyl-3-methyl-5-hydroxy-6-metoxy-1,4-benzoquinol methylase